MTDFIVLYNVEVDEDGSWKTRRGMLFAANFVDAVSQLEHHIYGQDLMRINSMELFDTIPEFSEETMKLIQKDLEDKG